MKVNFHIRSNCVYKITSRWDTFCDTHLLWRFISSMENLKRYRHFSFFRVTRLEISGEILEFWLNVSEIVCLFHMDFLVYKSIQRFYVLLERKYQNIISMTLGHKNLFLRKIRGRKNERELSFFPHITPTPNIYLVKINWY